MSAGSRCSRPWKTGKRSDESGFLERQRSAGLPEQGLRRRGAGAGSGFFCVQETKLQAGQLDLTLPGYTSYWDYAEKKGYSGTMILAKNRRFRFRSGSGMRSTGMKAAA